MKNNHDMLVAVHLTMPDGKQVVANVTYHMDENKAPTITYEMVDGTGFVDGDVIELKAYVGEPGVKINWAAPPKQDLR